MSSFLENFETVYYELGIVVDLLIIIFIHMNNEIQKILEIFLPFLKFKNIISKYTLAKNSFVRPVCG